MEDRDFPSDHTFGARHPYRKLSQRRKRDHEASQNMVCAHRGIRRVHYNRNDPIRDYVDNDTHEETQPGEAPAWWGN